MHIVHFTDHPQHLEFIVEDGARQAMVLLEKKSGKVVRAEAVGGACANDCFSFADEAGAWLSRYARPKRLTGRRAA
jgi:hypothetical protein